MKPRPSVGAACAWLLASACALAACTGDDEIYATPRVSPVPDAASGASSSGGSSGGASSSSSGSVGTQDGGPGTDAATDGAVTNDGGDASTDGGAVDSGVDSGPVVCSTVPCAGNATCTAVGCGSCNMGLGFCKP